MMYTEVTAKHLFIKRQVGLGEQGDETWWNGMDEGLKLLVHGTR